MQLGKIVELKKKSQQNVVADYHGHPVRTLCLLFKQSVDCVDQRHGRVVSMRVQPRFRPPQQHVRVDGDGEVVVIDGRDVHDVDGDVDDGGAPRQLQPLVVGRQAEAGHALREGILTPKGGRCREQEQGAPRQE